MTRDTTSEEPNPLRELRRVIEAPLRRPLLLVVPLVLVLAGAVALSFVLPPLYTSSTLIEVAPDRTPGVSVPQMSTETAARRRQTLRQGIQSAGLLKQVARELNPYGNWDEEQVVDIVEEMRGAMTVTLRANSAVSVEFEHANPNTAMQVTDRLISLFLDEWGAAPQREVSNFSQFIGEQLQEARADLGKKEDALREYKERHMGTLPEEVTSNLATLQRLQMKHQTISESLRRATDTLVLLESEPSAASVGAASGLDGKPLDSLSGLRMHLTQLLTRYTPEHPDVRALQARIAALAKAEAEAAGEIDVVPSLDPVAAQARFRALEARREVDGLRTQLATVERRIATFQARVEAAPRREQDILSLTRDYEKLRENHTKLLGEKFRIDMATRQDQHSKNERFRIIDHAYLPEEPSFPNRGLFALAGALGGLLLGVGLAAAVDLLDPTIKDVQELRTALPYPVLAVIPYIKPREQRRLAAVLPDDTQPRSGLRRVRRMSNTVPFRRAGGRGESA